MEYTKNYHLPQWVESDRIQMEDFNAAMESIESGLDSKAEKSAVTDMGEEITVVAQAVEAMASNLGSGGENCRIAWGNYTGKGTYGASKANQLNFDFRPVLVVIGSSNETNTFSWPSFYLRGCNATHPESAYDQKITVTWTDTGVSWYATTDNPNYPGWYQNNVSGRTYYYCAIGTSNS